MQYGYKRAGGRPPKVNWTVIVKLADSLQHNATVSEACRYAGISRTTYYRHLDSDDTFAIRMEGAMSNQDKLVMSFVTPY